MIATSTNIRGVVVALVLGILAVTFLPLGIVFTILAQTGAGDFPVALGLAFVAAGVLCGVAAFVSHRSGRARTAREEAARVSHGSAEVVEARHNYNSQVGVRHPLKLTVELAGGRRTRTLYVPSHIDYKPGERIEVTFAPDDPENFVPVA